MGGAGAAASYHRVVPHWGVPARERLTDFWGEDIFRVERRGQYKPDMRTLEQSYSQGILATSFASESPWQHCLQEISQLVQVSARPPAEGQYQLHKADMVSFKEPSPPREVWVAEVSKSCPRQEESPMLAAGCPALCRLSVLTLTPGQVSRPVHIPGS